MNAGLIQLAVTAQTSRHVIDSLIQSGFLAQFICLVLLAVSVATWAVMFRKAVQFRRMQQEDARFTQLYEERGGDFGLIQERSSAFRESSRAYLFREVCAELRRVAQVTGGELMMNRETLRLADRRAERAISEVVARTEQHLLILAQAASSCPFIGLFGTIWGLLGAFRSMGLAGNASIATVGVGVSEALITTLVGLLAAIPACYAFNHFRQKTDELSEEMENFRADLMGRLTRNALYHEHEAQGDGGRTRRRADRPVAAAAH